VGAIATVCTADAKMCPDGSYVDRTGPNCEFAACPNEITTPPPPPPPPPGGNAGSGSVSGSNGQGNAGEKGGTEDINIGVGEGSVSGSAGGGSDVSIKATELRGWDTAKKEEFMMTVKAHAELQSGQELENFARGILLSDQKASEVTVDENGVGMRYSMPAKFLGVFNASFRMHTSVDGSGNVTVQYPWYTFLYKDYASSDEVKADIQAALEAEAMASTKNDSAKMGGILNILHMTLKAGSEKWLRADIN
jgi:hypothetical protein